MAVDRKFSRSISLKLELDLVLQNLSSKTQIKSLSSLKAIIKADA
jgi:hypothetical protein